MAEKVRWYLGLDVDPERQITVTCGSTEAMAAVSDGEQQGILSKLRELISVGNKQLGQVLCYLYEKLEQDGE